MWTYILGSRKKNSSTLKRLVWKDNKKRLSNWSNEKCPKPSRNANLAKVSCENFAKFGSYKCAFRCSQNDILKSFLRARFPVRRDVYVVVCCCDLYVCFAVCLHAKELYVCFCCWGAALICMNPMYACMLGSGIELIEHWTGGRKIIICHGNYHQPGHDTTLSGCLPVPCALQRSPSQVLGLPALC